MCQCTWTITAIFIVFIASTKRRNLVILLVSDIIFAPSLTNHGSDGSRISDTPAEYENSQTDEVNRYELSYSAGVSQRIDLHDLELFLESSSLSTVAEVTCFGSPPQSPQLGTVVDIGGLKVGTELVIHLDGGTDKEKEIFLTTQKRARADLVENQLALMWRRHSHL